ncbi:alpha/beta fold hydrolase [Kribbella pratensis]|uniref:Homoserine O-acetyltransferase n=1 Tax=Kribbella pratensis TaxID=2512112 RepID=A0A4R8CNK6_9ACTN|nr:alpha/beta fold hydrolase [Kribbella pratensis]TDW77708.1 homoserine O-acetyltransferase [Kribbella pratensis]
MSTVPTVRTGIFKLGDLETERGGVIRDAQLSWQTHGTLSPTRDNVIVYPCSYGATHETQEWLIGPDGVLDPERWFIVIPDMFSNGLSSSASTDPDFPSLVTMADNVHAQYRLLTEEFGIDRLAAAYGFSMGAGQAYHWAALYPGFVERAIVVCGSARTSLHNRVFLSGLLRILEAAPEYCGNGRFTAEPIAAKRAFAHVYAGWGLSQDFYRARLFESVLGAPDLDSFLQTDWVDRFAESAAADLYAQALTWLEADISTPFDDDLVAALGAITARVLLMPSATDLYFRTADNELELASLRAAELVEIPSIWGHRAGSPRDIPADLDFLRRHVRDWLDA